MFTFLQMFVIRCGFCAETQLSFFCVAFFFVPLPIADRSDTFEAHALVFRRAAVQSAAWSRTLVTKNHRTDDCGFDGQRAEVRGRRGSEVNTMSNSDTVGKINKMDGGTQGAGREHLEAQITEKLCRKQAKWWKNPKWRLGLRFQGDMTKLGCNYICCNALVIVLVKEKHF